MAEKKLITGIYPGTFDPITLGHLDIVRRSLRLVDRLIIAVARSTHKKANFDSEMRERMIIDSLEELGIDCEVKVFGGLLVDFARKVEADVIIRGLRAVSDFEYEFQMTLMNKKMAPEVEQIYLTPDLRYIYISSSLVRQVAQLGGPVSDFVTGSVEKHLRALYA